MWERCWQAIHRVNCKAGEGSPGQQLKWQALYSILYGTYSLKSNKLKVKSYCYTHGVICKLCWWFGNCWRVSGGRDPSPVTPWSLLHFVCEALGIRKFFLPLRFLCTLAELSSWEVVMWARSRVERSLSGHILGRERKCIASLRLVIIPHPGPWTGYTPSQDRQATSTIFGYTEFYRHFLPQAVVTQAPLHAILSSPRVKGSHPISWTPELSTAFKKCKVSLSCATRFAHPNSSARLALITNASTSTMGAILQKCVQNSWQPLAFFSKKLKRSKNTVLMIGNWR